MQHGEYIFCPSEKHLPHIVNNPFFFVFRFRTAFSLLTCGTFQKIDMTSCCFGLYKAEINSKLNGLFRFSDLGCTYIVMLYVSPTKVMKNRTIFFYNMLCNIIGAFFDVPRGPVDNHQHMSGIRPPTKSHFCLMLSGWGVCSSLLPSSLDPLLDLSAVVTLPLTATVHGTCFLFPSDPYHPSSSLLILWRWMLPIAYWPDAYSSSLTWQEKASGCN